MLPGVPNLALNDNLGIYCKTLAISWGARGFLWAQRESSITNALARLHIMQVEEVLLVIDPPDEPYTEFNNVEFVPATPYRTSLGSKIEEWNSFCDDEEEEDDGMEKIEIPHEHACQSRTTANLLEEAIERYLRYHMPKTIRELKAQGASGRKWLGEAKNNLGATLKVPKNRIVEAVTE
jgi:hypothetical protein